MPDRPSQVLPEHMDSAASGSILPKLGIPSDLDTVIEDGPDSVESGRGQASSHEEDLSDGSSEDIRTVDDSPRRSRYSRPPNRQVGDQDDDSDDYKSSMNGSDDDATEYQDPTSILAKRIAKDVRRAVRGVPPEGEQNSDDVTRGSGETAVGRMHAAVEAQLGAIEMLDDALARLDHLLTTSQQDTPSLIRDLKRGASTALSLKTKLTAIAVHIAKIQARAAQEIPVEYHAQREGAMMLHVDDEDDLSEL
ncbi:hypothetical protein PYCC9005_002185 [Savitreella phatthalungensis]